MLEDARRDALRKRHAVKKRVIPAQILCRFTLLVIEMLGAAGFGYKWDSRNQVIDHFVAQKRLVTPF